MKPGAELSRVLALILLLLVASLAMAVDFDRLLHLMNQRFGQSGVQTLHDWQKMMNAAGQKNSTEKLRQVNEFFNRRVRFAEDRQIWGESDYWASPLETLGKGAGDCEDFTIAKYFTLLNLGIPNEQLRLIYVKARIGGMNSSITQAHMVLVFYPTPDSEPLVLDNLITEIRPAGRRPDLVPVFSFNSQGVWQGAAGNNAPGPGGVGSLSRWQNLLLRARAEGFE